MTEDTATKWRTGSSVGRPLKVRLRRGERVIRRDEVRGAAVTEDTVTIDGQVYDRQAVYDWLAAHDIPADCIPTDGVRNLDRDAGTVEVHFMAHDKQGNPILDRQRHQIMLTEWMEGRYSHEPPEPLYAPDPAA